MADVVEKQVTKMVEAAKNPDIVKPAREQVVMHLMMRLQSATQALL